MKAAENNYITETNALTGGNRNDKFLIHQLVMAARKAESIDIVVSFLMESGVRMILDELKDAVNRGVRIRMLTCDYLGITEPSALWMIKKELGDGVDLRLFSGGNRSFHAKSYIFHYGDHSHIFVGSSNLSKSALTYGFEWNCRIEESKDPEAYGDFMAEFENLYENHSIRVDDSILIEYSKHYRKPAVMKDLRVYENRQLRELQKKNGRHPEVKDFYRDNLQYELPKQDPVTGFSVIQRQYKPRGVQVEVLYSLQEKRSEGCTRAMVQAATGIGKTAIAAFDARNFGASRVLFVAHRIEILKQAESTFRNILETDDTGIVGGGIQGISARHIFASVATLGRKDFLNEDNFNPDDFDYIVIDEFHHAVNEGYRNIMEYFTPQFMLGLTATPDRMDGRDIYRICDYNVAYEVDLYQAINRGMLVPFHYYGIYDETRYDGLKLNRGNYRATDLEILYIGDKKRNRLILGHYRKHRSKCAIGFCITRRHAEDMAEVFCKSGVSAAACYSNPQADSKYWIERDSAIEKLKSGNLKVLFAVDMFNEGVDIPSIDMVMFLRPTESPVVFLQQLGRGLRIEEGKNYLTVLDFIGNYRRADRVPLLLTGRNFGGKGSSQELGREPEDYYPDDCIVDFDLETINMMERMRNRRISKKQLISDEFQCIMEKNGQVPSRIQLFSQIDDQIYGLCRSSAKDNPFRHYLDFLNERKLLDEEEEVLYRGKGRELISFVETTSMSRVYKMPVLMGIYNGGDTRMKVTEQQLLAAWKDFFYTGVNWKDLRTKDVITREDVMAITDGNHLSKIKKMPCFHLIKSGKGLFGSEEGYPIVLNQELEEYIKDKAFLKHMKDAIEYRIMDYYRTRYEKENTDEQNT